jgi:hypothetical protein
MSVVAYAAKGMYPREEREQKRAQQKRPVAAAHIAHRRAQTRRHHPYLDEVEQAQTGVRRTGEQQAAVSEVGEQDAVEHRVVVGQIAGELHVVDLERMGPGEPLVELVERIPADRRRVHHLDPRRPRPHDDKRAHGDARDVPREEDAADRSGKARLDAADARPHEAENERGGDEREERDRPPPKHAPHQVGVGARAHALLVEARNPGARDRDARGGDGEDNRVAARGRAQEPEQGAPEPEQDAADVGRGASEGCAGAVRGGSGDRPLGSELLRAGAPRCRRTRG